jgi:hypothetical protein
VLVNGGLGAAVDALRDDTDLIVDPDLDDRRYPALVEMAAYLAVLDCIRSAEREHACRVAVSCHSDDDRLVVRISWSRGAATDPDLVRVQDRVGALGGTLTADDRGVEAVIPCAS